MRYLITVLAAVFLCPAKADIVTEFGIGYKLETSSALLNPLCTSVTIPNANPLRSNPSSPHWGRNSASCGGDNPIFIGYPIKWESDYRGPWAWSVGWLHFSSIADGGNVLDFGGDRHEVHMDAVVISAKFNWSRRR